VHPTFKQWIEMAILHSFECSVQYGEHFSNSNPFITDITAQGLILGGNEIVMGNHSKI